MKEQIRLVDCLGVPSSLWLQSEDGQPRKQESMRLSRSRLRQTLLARIPPDQMVYRKTCTSAELPAQGGGPVQLRFADGSTAECDLLIVADGASSKIRTSLLPHETNRYAGVTMLYVSAFDPVQVHLSIPACKIAILGPVHNRHIELQLKLISLTICEIQSTSNMVG